MLLAAPAVAQDREIQLSNDGAITYIEGATNVDVNVDPLGCATEYDTYLGSFNGGTGWTISDGLVADQGPGTQFTAATDFEVCEIGFLGGHVTGPNNYLIWLLDDAGDTPGTVLESWSIDNLGAFGSGEFETVVTSVGGTCLTAGEKYWLAVIADGGGATWGASNWTNGTGGTPLLAGYRVASSDWVVFGANDPGCWRVTGQACGGGGVSLAYRGPCPGPVTAAVSGATPGGTVGLIYSSNTGSFTIPSGICAGTVTGLAAPVTLFGTATADGSGNATFSGTAPQVACGLYIQAIDASTCGTSNVEQVL